MPTKLSQKFDNFHLVTHPLLQHKLALLRDKHTGKKLFNELVGELAMMLAYAATQELPLGSKTIETPMQRCKVAELTGKKPLILPILRAGLGMVEGILQLMPAAKVGHIGMFRDEKTLMPQRYYFKIPKDSEQRHIYICDPMLATGGTAVDTINQLKQDGIKDMTFLCLVAAPEGMQHLCQHHPDVPIYAASLDEKLNSDGYILPGLGDAGDRLFGTM